MQPKKPQQTEINPDFQVLVESYANVLGIF